MKKKDRQIRNICLALGILFWLIIIFSNFKTENISYNNESKKIISSEEKTESIQKNISEKKETTIKAKASLNTYSSLDYCGYDVYNCDDFSTCLDVMEVFNACSYDANHLDRDNDNIPCENLCG